MNGRACQLCGKPLSRLWPSSGGDFCSREHRSQYRLRVGMDTLLEANKHASLMRRRDQLRQFTATQLRATGNSNPTGCEAQRIELRRPAVRRMPLEASAYHPKIEVTADYVDQIIAQHLDAAPRASAKPGKAPRRYPILTPRESRRMPVSIARAELANLHSRFKSPAARRRGFFMLRNRARTYWLPELLRSLEGVQGANLKAVRGRGLKSTANPGNRFRVSVNHAFRRPELRLKAAALPGPDSPSLAWPEGVGLAPNAYAGTGRARTAAAVGMPARLPLTPDTPEVFTPQAPVTHEPIPLKDREAYEIRLDVRQADWIWSVTAGPQWKPSGMRPGDAATGPNCLPVQVRPAGAQALCREESARFQPADQPWIAAPSLWDPSR